jgi:hypothetical protein
MIQKHSLSVDYAVVSVLANLSDAIPAITTEKPVLHNVFYSNRGYSVLKNVAFETTYFPYSESIEQAFDNIEMSGLISKANPIFQKFTLNKKALSSFYEREIKSKLTSKQIKEIKGIAQSLQALVSHP